MKAGGGLRFHINPLRVESLLLKQRFFGKQIGRIERIQKISYPFNQLNPFTNFFGCGSSALGSKVADRDLTGVNRVNRKKLLSLLAPVLLLYRIRAAGRYCVF